MNIEQQCNTITNDIKYWEWEGEPYSEIYSMNYIYICVDVLIKHADKTECLTSPSKYIRECKKWYMENE